MSKRHTQFKLGTADTSILAIGTLAIDYICTSEKEIVEIQPGGKKICATVEEFEDKINRYGIIMGQQYPGSSLGNFISQIKKLTNGDGSLHLATTLALQDPTTQLLLNSLKEKKISYEITDFSSNNAKNPTALLVQFPTYTKIFSFKDTRMPSIQITERTDQKPGLIVIGASAGDGAHTKLNALTYAKKYNIPVAVLTTENETSQFSKNDALRNAFKDVLSYASFFAVNEDEVRKLLLLENPTIKPAHDKIQLALQLRTVFNNDNLDILLSYGADGALAVIGNNVYIQKIPTVQPDEILSTAGAGDALAGAFVHGIRLKGMDPEGICWSLSRASRTAQNTLRYADTQTGQLNEEEFLQEPPDEYEIEIVTLKENPIN